MRHPLPIVPFLCALTATLVINVEARAQTAIVAQSDTHPQINQLQVASTFGTSTVTSWLRANVTSTKPQTWLLITAVKTADRVDISSDAWFEALMMSTSPRLLPPEIPPEHPCGATPSPNAALVLDDLSHVPSIQASDSAKVMDIQQLFAYAKAQGVSLQQSDWAWRLSELDQQGYRFVTLPFHPAGGTFTLPTVRVTSQTSTDRLPLLLNRLGGTGTDINAWLFGAAPTIPSNQPWTTIDERNVLWILGEKTPSSTYDDELTSMMDDAHGNLWVVQNVSTFSLVTETSASNGTLEIPALGRTYLERFDAYAQGNLPVSDCLAALEKREGSNRVVARTCAPGKLATVADTSGQPPTDCVEQPGSTQVPPNELRCGGKADDLALALSELSVAQAKVTRMAGRVQPWSARPEQPITTHLPLDEPIVLICGGWDTSACNQQDAGTGGTGGTSSSGGTGATGSGAYGGNGGGPVRYYDPDEIAEDQENPNDVYVNTSCWGSPSSTSRDPSDESTDDSTCDGDSSSGNDDSSCSGDSSSGNNDSSCSGDSSSGNDDSSCSGDSSSGNDDSSCSGDSSSGSHDATCSGGDAGDSDCSVSNRRKRRKIPSLATAWLMALLLLPIRRLSGRRRRSKR